MLPAGSDVTGGVLGKPWRPEQRRALRKRRRLVKALRTSLRKPQTREMPTGRTRIQRRRHQSPPSNPPRAEAKSRPLKRSPSHPPRAAADQRETAKALRTLMVTFSPKLHQLEHQSSEGSSKEEGLRIEKMATQQQAIDRELHLALSRSSLSLVGTRNIRLGSA